jgi:hypothetical protein
MTSDDFIEKHIDRRDELAFRELRDDTMSPSEVIELQDLNAALLPLLPKPEPLPAQIKASLSEIADQRKSLDEEARRLMAALGAAENRPSRGNRCGHTAMGYLSLDPNGYFTSGCGVCDTLPTAPSPRV